MDSNQQNLPARMLYRLRRTRLAMQLLLPFGRTLHPSRWVFVVGCYNSGTTLLARILGEHSDVGALPDEGVFFTDALPYPERLGWTRMWHRCTEEMEIDPSPTSVDRARRIQRQWSLWYDRDKPVLLEKSVANVPRLRFLQEHFSPAYFVSIVRNGYAVAEGIRRKARTDRWRNPDYPTGYPIDLCARQWTATLETLTRSVPLLERFIEIRYEDLVRDPGRVIGEITDFLEISQVPDDILEGAWTLQGRTGIIRDRNPESFARLDEADRAAIVSVAGDWLRRYEYGIPP